MSIALQLLSTMLVFIIFTLNIVINIIINTTTPTTTTTYSGSNSIIIIIKTLIGFVTFTFLLPLLYS